MNSKNKWICKKLLECQNRENFEKTQKIFGSDLIEEIDLSKYDKFLADELGWYINSAIENYSKIMKVAPKSIIIKKLKAIWGSCDGHNNLKFNSQLAKFPREIIDYVVVHELAHIKYKHHQKPFWSFIEVVMPDYKKRSEKLKKFLTSH